MSEGTGPQSQDANVRIFPGGLTSLSGSNIVNDSSAVGANVKTALDYLIGLIAAIPLLPYTTSSLAEQDLLSYDASAATWRNRTRAAALKGTGTGSLALMGGLAAGTNDIVIGTSAGNALNTGTDNIAIGTDTLDSATEALSGMVAIGSSALSGALTAVANNTVAIGYGALNVLTSGSQNIGVGYFALSTLTTGTNNTAMGYLTGASISSGARNTLYGSYTDSASGAIHDNTYVGYGVGNSAAGGRNTAVGSSAFNSASTPVSDIVAIGYNALTAAINNTGASGSVAIGSGALQNLTTSANTAIGYQAGNPTTSGAYNTFIGYNTRAAATASSNTFVGYSVGNANVGATNVAVGASCFNTIGSGSPVADCVVIGAGAMVSASFGTAQNGTVAIGKGALSAINSTGAGTTAVGYQAGNTIIAGHSNTIVGYDANVSASGRSGCVILGRNASAAADDTLVIRMGNASSKEIVVTPVVDATPPAGAVTYLPITIGGTSYRILLQAP